MGAGVNIRRIRPDEGDVLRDLRLRSLADAPEAFGQTFDEAAQRPAADWDSQARAASDGDRRSWLIAFADDRAVGLVQGRRRPPDELLIFSMWVESDVRRSGVGRMLIDAMTDWGRGWGARQAVLWVFAGNEGAMRFYDRLGFVSEPDGPNAESGRAYGAVAMFRSIDPDSTGAALEGGRSTDTQR